VISYVKNIQLQTNNILLCSIFTVEAYYGNLKYTLHLIISDSLSTLISIYNLNIAQPIIICQIIINELHDRKNNISFAWILEHIGIIGNKKSDLKAKEITDYSYLRF